MTTGSRLVSISKFLSLVLRHKPEEIGLALDESGWAALAELVRLSNQHGTQLTRELVEEVVAKNDKQRFMISPDRTKIRANQGHSIEVELGLAAAQPPELLFHGTIERFLDSIRTQGLHRGNRRHVHLSADEHTARGVATRRGRLVILTVAARMMSESGHMFYLSQNGVWLTEHVPPEFIGYPG